MVLLEFSITPLGAGAGVSQDVARAVDIIDRSGLDYRLHAMGTIVEGELDQVLSVLKECVENMAQHHSRVSVSAKLDYRQGAAGRLTSKVAKIEQTLGRPLKK